VVLWAVLGGIPQAARATPITDVTITGWTDTSIDVIKDGTSNTILFGEQTIVSTCLQNVVSLGDITDGTSNTILFGETTGVCLEDAPHVPVTRTTLPGITDGTSNTILVGETGMGYFVGGNARVDLCATNVSIADGTSNTIVLLEDESVCFAGAQIAPAATPTAVPEPTTALLLTAGALVGLTTRRCRRTTRR
jgi:hypothetical protein